MSSHSLALLQAGALLGAVMVGQMVALRHLPTENVPLVLRGRVDLSNRLRPWLLAASGILLMAGLFFAF